MSQTCKTGLSVTAVPASTDHHAFGALTALKDAQYAVPAAVSVMGIDDYLASGVIRSSLTADAGREDGPTTVVLFRLHIEGGSVNEETMFQAKLIERGSQSF